jgi:CHAD domain-containing protein
VFIRANSRAISVWFDFCISDNVSKPGLFNDYLLRCFTQLEKSLADYRRTCNNKLLFRFRVSIKKIRTCLDCIEYYQGKKKFKKTRKQLKGIFRSGGILRELRIYHAWFKQHHFLRLATCINLSSQIKEKEQAFTGNASEIVAIIKDARITIVSAAKKLKQQDVHQFYLAMLHDRLSLLTEKPAIEKWHGARKQYKKILYARHWEEAAGLAVLSKRQAVFVDQLQHLIGYWHDNDMMIEWLKEQQPACKQNASSQQLFKPAYDLLKEKSRRWKKRVDNKFDQLPGRLQPMLARLKKAQ